MNKTKYSRTFHFSWSENLQNDDRMLSSDNILEGKNIVITHKMDGESCSMYFDATHARSLDSQHHPSRNWVKSLWGSIRHMIPDDIRICGENCYGQHSIPYENLPSFFFVFGVYQDINEQDTCLSWDETENWCQKLGLQTVPVIYKGPWNIDIVKKSYTGTDPYGNEQEGYVVRNADRFLYNDFEHNVGKFVRKNHVQTDDFWMKNWKPNKLKEN
jgi:hypothetical protein